MFRLRYFFAHLVFYKNRKDATNWRRRAFKVQIKLGEEEEDGATLPALPSRSAGLLGPWSMLPG